MSMAHQPTDHIITVEAPKEARCESCGWKWDLRVCTSCGYIGCCESHDSHASAHSKRQEHSVIRRYPPDDLKSFAWCYPCDSYLNLDGTLQETAELDRV